MTSNFPTSLDDFMNPNSLSSLSNPPHSEQHSNLNDAVEALETKVGIDNSIDENSIDYRLAVVEGLGNSLGDYVLLSDVGNAGGPAELNSSKHLMLESTISYTGNAIPITTTNIIKLDEWEIDLYTTVEYTIQVIQGTKFRSSKVFLVTDKISLEHTEYGIIQIGSDISGLSINASVSPSNRGVLSIQISDADVSNAQVKVFKSTIS